jgi:hypothetical protein
MDRAYSRGVERVAVHAPAFPLSRRFAFVYARANLASNARNHFARGLFCERHSYDVRHAPARILFEQPQESLDQHTSLSRPRASRHYHAPPAYLYRITL